ncbi:MAG: hypothetical protein R8J41_11100 [Alphaproteobacteria bacterium]|nr:hypothetical protein [Alphaproteobacteria bacterium]
MKSTDPHQVHSAAAGYTASRSGQKVIQQAVDNKKKESSSSHEKTVEYGEKLRGNVQLKDQKKREDQAKILAALKNSFKRIGVEMPESEKLEFIATDLFFSLFVTGDFSLSDIAGARFEGRYPVGYQLYRGKRSEDGDPITFYDRWWRDADGNHTVYRVDLKRLDPKLMRALDNHASFHKLDRQKFLPPPISKKTEDMALADELSPEARKRAKTLIRTRESKKAYCRRQKLTLDPTPS